MTETDRFTRGHVGRANAVARATTPPRTRGKRPITCFTRGSQRARASPSRPRSCNLLRVAEARHGIDGRVQDGDAHAGRGCGGIPALAAMARVTFRRGLEGGGEIVRA